MNYIVNFAVYTMAMIGFFGIILFVYKKSINTDYKTNNKELLKVENMLRLGASKTIYVIKAGNEKFLIAGDPSTTTLISKLENYPEPKDIQDIKIQNKINSINITNKI